MGARSFEKVVAVKLSPVIMVASFRRPVSGGVARNRKRRKEKAKETNEERGRCKESHFLSSFPPPPPSPQLYSVLYFPLRRPYYLTPGTAGYYSGHVHWRTDLLKITVEHLLDLSGQWQRQLFIVLSPVFHNLLFLNLRSGPILVAASIHSPNRFASLPAGISFPRRRAFFGFINTKAAWLA